MVPPTSAKDDPVFRAWHAVSELAAAIQGDHPELAEAAKGVALLAITAMQGARVGIMTVTWEQIKILYRADHDAGVRRAETWHREIEGAGAALKKAKGAERQRVVVTAIWEIAAVSSIDPGFREALMALVQPEQFEATATLLAKCTGVRSKRDKPGAPPKVQAWQGIAVELLIRAGLLPATMTPLEKKRFGEKFVGPR